MFALRVQGKLELTVNFRILVRHAGALWGQCGPTAGPGELSAVGRIAGDEVYGRLVQVTVGQVIARLERDGWELRQNTETPRHYSHPRKPGLVTLAGAPGARLSRKAEAATLKQAGLGKERP
jgi:predicted RNA binding protein YcfA (HicA-like mRNA interferase family)